MKTHHFFSAPSFHSHVLFIRLFSTLRYLTFLLLFLLQCSVASAQGPGSYFIQSAVGGKYLDVRWGDPASGTPVHLWDFNGGAAQHWTLIASGDGYYYLKSRFSKYLDVRWGDSRPGTAVHIWDVNRGPAQRWRFVPASDGYYYIQSSLGTFLDVQWGSARSGTPIWTWTFTGGDAQKWRLVPDILQIADDLDNDGLSDTWEIAQRSAMPGLNPSRANLILVPVLRPNVTRDEVLPALDRVVDFFARVPNRNRDGTTGITVVVQWGNTLSDIHSDAPGRTPPNYPEARAPGMPAALIGKGHGILIGSGRGGGGQTSHSDWSGVSNNWHTIVHELGHQLGLEHEPKGTGIASCLYTSIMNYDYNYEFNFDPDAVHFSTGRFCSMRMNERNLNETLPFPMSDLRFLSVPPYNLPLRSAEPSSTQIDFDRDGVFGERGSHADVNGGSSLTVREEVNFGNTAGGFSLATLGGQLVAIYSSLPPPLDWSTYTQAGFSVSNPGQLMYQIYSRGRLQTPRLLTGTGVTGDPHAVEAFGKLFVTYPTASGYIVASYRNGLVAGQLQIAGFAHELRAPSSHLTLVRTSPAGQLYLFIWDEVTKQVRYRQVIASAASDEITLGPVSDLNLGYGDDATPITSNGPVGGTWNSKTARIAIVTANRSEGMEGRMKLITLGRYGTSWYGQREEWVMGSSDRAATLTRPTVLFDDRPAAGIHGQYLIYSLYERYGSDLTLTELIRRVPGTPGAWVKQLMVNVWTTTRSAPSATLYRDDIAWGWRVNEGSGDRPNVLQVFLKGSGITDAGLTDFDDVHWITTRGLRESLLSVPL